MKPINWNGTRTQIRTNLKEIKIRSISSKISEKPIRFNKKNTTESWIEINAISPHQEINPKEI